MEKLPKDTPETIYLDLGFEPDGTENFNELVGVSWSDNNATGDGVEYVRKDVAEQIANAFAEQMAKAFAESHEATLIDWVLGGSIEPNIDLEFTELMKLKK